MRCHKTVKKAALSMDESGFVIVHRGDGASFRY